VDDEEVIVTELGLLLNQVRFSRLALENIERSTARYAGLAVALSGGGAAAIGAPPLKDGALRVYVVNLGDLAGPSAGDLILGVLGGAGRFLGGLVGGLVGGTVGGVVLPFKSMDDIARITESLSRLYNLYLWAEAKADKDKKPDGGAEEPSSAATYLAIVVKLPPVLAGLTVVLPLLTGTVASLLNRVPQIKNVVLDVLEFAVRNALRLRAVIFAVVVDGVALAGRLVAGVLTIMAKAVDDILASIFRVVRSALEAVFELMRILGPGLKRTIDQFINFLNNDVVGTLNAIGDTALVKLVWHFTLTLPLVLPALARIKGITLTKAESDALTTAQALRPRASMSAPRPTIISKFPDASALAGKAERDAAFLRLEKLGVDITLEADAAFGAATGAVRKSAGMIEAELGTADAKLKKELESRLADAKTDSDKLAGAMKEAKQASSGLPQVDRIAEAYEKWLTTTGLSGLMGAIKRELVADAAGPQRDSALLGKVVDGPDRPPPSVPVEIDKITIQLVKPSTPPAPAAGPARSKRTAAIVGGPGSRGGRDVDPALVARMDEELEAVG